MGGLRRIILGLAGLTLPLGTAASAPSEAELPFPPKAAPIVAPDVLDGLAREEVRDANPHDLVYSFGSNAERVTLYVFRATNPNAALWFERADAILNMTFKPRGLGEGTAITPVTTPGAPEANGLSRVYSIKGDYKSTALSIVEVNGWMVKIRSSSKSLDTAGQQARMARVVNALTAIGPVAKPHKLLLPEACPEDRAQLSMQELLEGEVIAKPKMEDTVVAGLSLTAHMVEVAGGEGSIAAAPENYCRAKLQEETPFAAFYRPKDSQQKGWTILFADSGRAIGSVGMIALPDSKSEARAMLVADQLDKSAVILLLKGHADANASWQLGAQAIINGASGMVSFIYDSKTLALPSK
jgi:hypothetical protein